MSLFSLIFVLILSSTGFALQCSKANSCLSCVAEKGCLWAKLSNISLVCVEGKQILGLSPKSVTRSENKCEKNYPDESSKFKVVLSRAFKFYWSGPQMTKTKRLH
jgi:hypothetical protein